MKPTCIAIVGPTGAGKSEAAIHLAKKLGHAEILSMDSMQVYRGLNIGTAKLSAQEMRGIPHHMIDITDPHRIYTVSEYREDAYAVLCDVLGRGNIPVFVGGTGLYLNALSYQMALGSEGSDEAYRNELKQIGQTEAGRKALYAQLTEADPDAAKKIHENDLHRVVRALEIYHLTGQRKSDLAETRKEGPYRFLVYGLTMDREALYARINERTDRMMAAGWLSEVRTLLAQGVPFRKEDGGIGQAIGYLELAEVIRGSLSLEEAVRQIKRNTRHYAKRQLTWFTHDPRTKWFNRSLYADGDALCAALAQMVIEDYQSATEDNDCNGGEGK